MDCLLVPGSSLILSDKVKLETFKESALAIGNYPQFKYNASKGGGVADIRSIESGRVYIEYDASQVNIPSLTWRTGRFLGAPIPPLLRIDIVPSQLQGFIELATGEIQLKLSADFKFSAAGLYRVSLHVDTQLSTESATSRHHNKKGSRLDSEGKAVLVGVGDVERTGSWVMNKILRLPTDVLGIMKSRFLICQAESVR